MGIRRHLRSEGRNLLILNKKRFLPLLLHEHLLLTVPVESYRKRSKPLQSKGFDLSVNFFASLLTRRDDLGRVVIPKEIRRTLRIREGDPLEIYTASDGEVIFKKYSPMGEISEFSGQYSDVLNRTAGLPVIITDRDHVISVSGFPKRDAMDKHVSPELEEFMENRESFIRSRESKPLYPIMGLEVTASIAYPEDYVKKVKKAAETKGPAYIHLQQPCTTGWGYPSEKTIEMGRLAVETGSWILYEIDHGNFEITYRPEERKPVKEYLAPQKRFRHLDDELIEKIQKYVDAECEELGL